MPNVKIKLWIIINLFFFIIADLDKFYLVANLWQIFSIRSWVEGFFRVWTNLNQKGWGLF